MLSTTSEYALRIMIVLAESETELIEDEMVICDLNAEAYEARRKGRCFNLQTRRPEVYWEIGEVSD